MGVRLPSYKRCPMSFMKDIMNGSKLVSPGTDKNYLSGILHIRTQQNWHSQVWWAFSAKTLAKVKRKPRVHEVHAWL